MADATTNEPQPSWVALWGQPLPAAARAAAADANHARAAALPARCRCYADRYPDLLDGFCGGAISGCDWTRLKLHFESTAAPGPHFACTVAAGAASAAAAAAAAPAAAVGVSAAAGQRTPSRSSDKRWREGSPATTPTARAVITQYDSSSSDENKPWHPCPFGKWCHRYANRRSAMIIFSGMQKVDGGILLFIHDSGGFVVRMSASDEMLRCSYSGDAGNGHVGRLQHQPLFSCGYCMWEPGKLKGMLECFLKSAGAGGGQYSGYNELVMDADAWKDHLPQTIEAVFYPVHTERDSSCRSKAETTHSSF